MQRAAYVKALLRKALALLQGTQIRVTRLLARYAENWVLLKTTMMRNTLKKAHVFGANKGASKWATDYTDISNLEPCPTPHSLTLDFALTTGERRNDVHATG